MLYKVQYLRRYSPKRLAVLLTVLVLVFTSFAPILLTKSASAAANSNINFQARLMNASGSIAPDGFYNIEFKIYDALTSSGSSQGSCTGDSNCLWTETYYDTNGVTAGNDFRVRVANGYVTVSLGSRTAFPSTMKWDQQLWITMNIGGTTQTATPTYDGEMAPRLQLTAVPFAFRAGALAGGTGANTTVLDTGTPSGNNTLSLPAETGTLCVQNAVSCGFLTGSASDYIQNQNASSQTADFRINGTGRADTALQSALFDTPSTGALGLGTTNANAINIGKSASNITTTVTGLTVIKPSSGNDSATAFQVQKANGNELLTVDSSNNQVILGKSSSIDGKLTFNNGTNGNTISLISGVSGSTFSLILPTTAPSTSQCLGTDSVTSNQLKFLSCGTSGTFLAKNATDTSSFAVTASNYLYDFTNSSSAVASSVLRVNNGTNTNSTFVATTAGNPTSGQAVLFASNTNASPSGNLLDLQSGSSPTSKFSVDAAGAVTAAGAINGQTISSSANFTGTVTIQGTNALTVGTTGSATGAVLFKGSTAASGTLTLIGQNNPTNNTLTLPNETGTICTSAATSPANCTNFAPATGSTVYATRALDNLASVNINAALGFQSNQTANINFNGAAAAGGNSLNITGQTAGATANAGGNVTIQGGTGTTTGTGGTLALLGGNAAATGTNGGVNIDAGSGATSYNGTITIGSAFASTITVGSTTLSAGTQAVNIGTNNTSGSTTNVNVGSGSSATGGTTTVQGKTATNVTSGGAVTITAGAASTFSTTSGLFTLQGNGGVTINTPASTSTSTSAINILSGNASVGSNLSAGTLTIDTGTKTGTGTAIVNVGNTNATAIQIGNANTTTTVTGALTSAGGAVSLNNSSNFNTSINTGTSTGSVTIGNGAAGALSLQSGSTLAIATTSFNLSTAGVVTLVGGQAGGDIVTAGAATATAITLQAGASSGASSNGGALNLNAGDATGTTNVTGGNVSIAAGNATGASGTRNGGSVTIDAGTSAAGAANNGTVSVGTTNAKTVTVGNTSAGIVLEGSNAGAIAIGNSNSAHTINIGNGGSSTAQAINIGSATNTTSTLALQGGTGASAITLTTGATGGTAGGIVIGNTSGANSQSISIGTNATSGATNVVHIGDAGTATDTVTIGSTTGAAGSTVAIQGGTTASGVGAVSIQAATGGLITIGTTNTNPITLGGITTLATLGTTNNSSFLCRNATNQIAGCSTTGTGAAFVQGGNAFGSTAILGTTDAQDLEIITGTSGPNIRAYFDQSNHLYLGNGPTAAAPNDFGVLGTGSTTAGTAGGALTIQGGAGTSSTTGSVGGAVSLIGGTAAGSGNNAGGAATVRGGTAVNTGQGGTLTLQGGNTASGGTNGTVNIDAGSGATTANGTVNIGASNASAINIGANNTLTNTVQIGATAQSAGTQTINIGNSNTSGGTTNVTIGSGSSATGGTTTVRAKGALTLTGGAASTWDVNGTLSLQTANNGAITTGTGLLTQGGDVTFSGTTARTITGPTTGGLTINDTGGNLTLSTTTSGTLAVTSAGALNLTGAAASSFNLGANALTLTSSNFSVSNTGTATLGLSTTNTGAVTFRGSGNSNTLTLQGPNSPTAGNFTLSIPAITANANVCTDNAICAGYQAAPASGSYIQTVPTGTVNIIQPTAASVIALTVNGTSNATGATALVVAQSQGNDAVNVNVTGSSQTNGILVNRTNAGTLSNGINVTNTSGTLTSGLAFTGTIGTDINRGAGILTLQGTGGVTVTAGGTTTLGLDSAGAGTVTLGNANATTINIGGTSSATTTIAGGNVAHTVAIASAGTSTIQAVTVGSTGSTSTLVLQGGTGTATGDINIGDQTTAGKILDIGSVDNAGTGTVRIATGAAAQTVSIGSTNSSSTTTIQGGTGNINLTVAAGSLANVTKIAGSGGTFQMTGPSSISSGATTMTATSGNSTFTTSGSLTLNAGDYIIPTTTTGQARVVTATATGTSFSVSPAFSAGVTAETFAVHRAIANFLTSGGSAGLAIQGSTGNIGAGTLAPTRQLDVAVNNSAVNALPLLIEQAGSGDVGLELKGASKNYYVGIDATDGQFKLSSAVAGATLTDMPNGPGGYTIVNNDSGNVNMISAIAITSSGSGTLDSISVYVLNSGTGGNHMKVALYDATGTGGGLGTALAISGSQTVTANSYNTFSMPGVSITNATNYWLALNVDDATIQYGVSSTGGTMRFSTGGANSQNFSSGPFPNSPATTSGAAQQYAMYMTVSGSASSDNFGASLLSVSDTGATKFQNAANSASALQIQNAAGSNRALNVDTTNNRVGIAMTTSELPSFDLSLGGGANRTIAVNQNPSTGAGNNLILQGGQGNGSGSAGGAVQINGGATGGAGNAAGGAVSLTGGTGNGSSAGGNIGLTAGTGGATGQGGTISIQGGTAGGGNTAGGATTLAGGTSTGTGTGGALIVQGGASSATGGSTGAATIKSQNANNGSGATAGGGAGTVSVTGGNGGAGTGTNSTGGNGAAVSITAGNGGAATGTGVNGNGGNISLQGGTVGTGGSGGTPTAGAISLTGGTGAGTLAGGNITVQGGTSGAGAAALGGNVTIQGGTGNGSGNSNGGNVTLQGGTPAGTGVKGLIQLNSGVYFTTGTYSSGTSSTITQSVVDSNSAIIATATTTGLTFTLPSPTNGASQAGRVMYVSNASSGSNAFTLSGAAASFVIGTGSTATLIWNGTAWTVAGVDSTGGAATSLQTAYTNSSSGSTTPEIILDGTRNGIDIQDKTGGSIGGTQGLLNVRGVATASTFGASLFVVNASGKVSINNGDTTATPTISYDLSFGQVAGVTTARTIGVEAQGTTNVGGNGLSIQAGTANGTGAGGLTSVLGGAASGTSGSAGGGVAITAANGTSTSTGGAGGAITITAGNGTSSGNNNGGTITLQAGSATGSGTIGNVLVKNAQNSSTAFQIQNTLNANAFIVDTTQLNTLIDSGNGSFENTISGWATKQGTTTGSTPARDTTQAYLGGASLKFALSSTAANDGVKYTPSPALSAVTYTLSFYIKQTAGTAFGTNLAVGWNNGTSDSNCTLSPSLSTQAVSTSGWVRYSCSFTGSASGHIYWKESDAPASARTWFLDAVQLEQASSAKPFKDNGISLNGVINSPVTLQNAADSTTALQIANAAGTALFDADTLNGYIGIGTGAPTRQLHLSVNNSTTTAPQALIEQLGSGDSTVEFKTTAGSFFTGVDTSDSGKYKIASSISAGSTARFGYDVIGGTADNADINTQNAVKFTMPASAGSVSSVTVYINAGSSSNQFQVAIYADDGTGGRPGTRLLTSSSQNIIPNAWNTVSLSTTFNASTSYWLAFNTNDSGANMRYDTGGANTSCFVGQTFGTWANPFGNSCALTNQKFSIYATYTLASSPDSFSASLFSMTASGEALFQNFVNSTIALQVQNATGTNRTLNVDASNNRVGIAMTTSELPSFDLSLGGGSNRTIGVNAPTATGNGVNLTVQAAAGTTTGTGGALTLQGGAGAGSGQAGGGVTINGGAAGTGNALGSAVTLNGGAGAGTQTGGNVVLQAGTGGATGNGGNVSLTAGNAGGATKNGGNITINGGVGNTSGTGGNITLQGGNGGNAAVGGTVTIQGGTAGGGNTNGGNVNITGGTPAGTGANGLVVINTPTFQTAATQSCGSNCNITQANIDGNGAVAINATAASLTVTMPDPSITTAGRIVYVTAANGSNDFTLSVNGGGTGNQIAMRQNTTATMIWNGSDWTAAGASSSTTLQAAYNNTLTSAGGAELIVSNGSNANGLTIRDSLTSPVSGTGIGTLLEVQTAQAASLLSVNSSVTDYANNGGGESTFGSEWAAIPSSGATITRNTSATYIATGAASTSIATTGSANQGAANTLNATLTANLRYNVSFATKLTAGSAAFTDLDVEFSKDGTTTAMTACTNYSTQTANTSVWSKVNCTFTAPSSGITSSNAVFIRQTAGATRTFYVDNLSVTISADLNYATDGGADDNTNFTTNWTAVTGTGATVTAIRSTTNGNDTSDSAEAHITVGGSGGNNGIRNKLSINPLTSTLYRISVYASSSTSMTDFTVRYSRDGGTNFDSCVDYNSQSLSGVFTTFKQITCYVTTSGTAPTNPYVYFTESGTGVRDIYVDTFTMTLASNAVPNVQIGGGVYGGPTTLFTLDRAASAPIAANNDALLGSMYYDTTLGKLQCYEADGWGACGSSPDNIITISPEYTNAVLHGPSGGTAGTGTMTSDLCSDALNINDGSSGQPTICGSNETYNFYKWTSPQNTSQTYAIYVTYQLPTTFKSFASGSTSIKGRTDSTNSTVAYKVYRNAGSGSGLTQCGSSVSVSTGSVSSWQPGLATGTADPSTCSFVGGDSIVFEIDLTASSSANAYVSNLGFTFSNR